MNLVGVIALPHLFATGEGGAKDELTAQIRLVVGNFLKRFTSIMWGITGVIAFALFGKIVSHPDMIWGYATKQLLGPGFVGIMIACLLAAVMSSADAFMVCESALFTGNFYRYLFPAKEESHYVFIGRIAGICMVLGAIILNQYFNDIFSLIKYIWQLPVIFGTVFWLSLFWRRLTKAAALSAVIYSWIMVVMLPNIFQEISWFTNHEFPQIVVRPTLFILYSISIDLSQLSNSWLATIDYTMQIMIPFSILFIVSIFSTPPELKKINGIFARLQTLISEDQDVDIRQIQQYIDNPDAYENRKLFPGSNWEFTKLDKKMTLGFLNCVALAVIILGFALLISSVKIP